MMFSMMTIMAIRTIITECPIDYGDNDKFVINMIITNNDDDVDGIVYDDDDDDDDVDSEIIIVVVFNGIIMIIILMAIIVIIENIIINRPFLEKKMLYECNMVTISKFKKLRMINEVHYQEELRQ